MTVAAPVTRTRTERVWAAGAHLTILLSLLVAPIWAGTVAVVGPIAVVVILVRSRASSWVRFQAAQAAVFQFIGYILYLLIPPSEKEVGEFIYLGFAAYAFLGALVCIAGRNFKYLLLGPFIEHSMK
ncbi:MAG: hypothetical protein HYX97_00710 [Chloroflexi bacterium]|nr:hypothetical protein [Chloroflexota bacterium]